MGSNKDYFDLTWFDLSISIQVFVLTGLSWYITMSFFSLLWKSLSYKYYPQQDTFHSQSSIANFWIYMFLLIGYLVSVPAYYKQQVINDLLALLTNIYVSQMT